MFAWRRKRNIEKYIIRKKTETVKSREFDSKKKRVKSRDILGLMKCVQCTK